MLPQTRREYRAGLRRRRSPRPAVLRRAAEDVLEFAWACTTDDLLRLGLRTGGTLLIAMVCWLGWHIVTVKNDLEAAQSALQADDALAEVGVEAASAASASADPIWRGAELIPVLGDNLRAVRLSAEAVDLAVNDIALPVLAMRDEATTDDDAEEGLLTRAIPVMTAAAPAAAALDDAMTAVAASGLLVDQVRSALETVQPVVAAMDAGLRLAPTLLGADGAKNYLLVFQNNAESLPLGGSAASQTLISADDGVLSIAAQANSGSFKIKPSVDVDVDESAIELYSGYLTSRVNTAVGRPDFETAAAILTAFWNRDIDDTQIDGVISIDPLVLPGVLDAVGSMTVDGVELTSDNVVQVLLSDTYAWWGSSDAEAKKADAFFATVAEDLFDKIASGDFDPAKMVSAIADSAADGDILVWSSDPTVNELFAGTRASGVMPTDNADQTVVGVYFFDHSGGSKIDYYMDSAVDLSSVCTGGTATYTASTTLHLDLTQEEADTLPVYVLSKNWGSAQTRLGVYVYGPPGTVVESVSVDGEDVDVLSTDIDDLGRPVAAFDVNLAPDQTGTVTATFSGATADGGALTLWSTPMVNTTDVTVDDGC
ncbi:MAG: DUF4012 domain-containing protein [Microbacterium sp.]